ncbi:MAG: hypothetical protein V7K27_31005 [Nostoc sp.]|uniref:hypothetical protein n=1 Tax=Nostoc sp. TaxID=1180 RepID=UPI002FF664C4
MGGAQRNPTNYQDVGLRKASTQPTIFLQRNILAYTVHYKTTEIFSEIKYDSYRRDQNCEDYSNFQVNRPRGTGTALLMGVNLS